MPDPSTRPTTHWTDAFVDRLADLASAQDRAALAALRRSLGRPSGAVAETHRYILPFAPSVSGRQLDALYLIAGLFASHPDPGGTGNMGGSMRRVLELRDTTSIEKRFIRLLDADAEDLPWILRQAVTLCRATSIRLDWRLLAWHIVNWDHPDRWVQRQWAQSFWDSRGPAPAAAATPSDQLES